MSLSDFLREAERLRRLEYKLEKETSRRSRDYFSVLEEFHNILKAELKADKIKVQQHLQKTRNCVYRLQAQLRDVKPSPDLINKLKDNMIEIENSINIFKDMQHQSFEELLKEEKTFWQEMCAFDQKIDGWCLPVKPDSHVSHLASIYADQRESRNLSAEVIALETFLQQSGGQYGGWDKYDHQSFLKLWTKHNGKPSYRKEAKLYLPDKTEENIKLHEEWYLKLCHLQEMKRKAIHRWRTAKQRDQELQREQQVREDLVRELDKASTAAMRLKQEEQRREVSERLEAWRSFRKQQLEQEEKQRFRDEIQQRKRAKEERRKQLELKLMVESYVQQIMEEKELLALEKEAQQQADREERHRLAAEGIKRFQKRDSHRLEITLQDKQRKQQEECEHQRRLAKLKEKVEVHISRDPSRLWRTTKGWEARTKETTPAGGSQVFHMFHRAVPAWRQDL